MIRTARFSARHRYWRPDWSEERNRRTFGPSSKPHGHDYVVEVEVRGEVDPETGFCVELPALDELLDTEVVERLDRQDLNAVLPAFAEGRRIPTTEELARWLYERLEDRIPGSARLVRVRLHESDILAAEFAGESPSG